MMRTVFCVLLIAVAVASQGKGKSDSIWQKEAVANLNYSNSWYDNWAAGGEDAATWNIKLNGKIERDVLKTNWKTSGKLGYGQTKLGSGNFRKSLDEMFLETIYSYKLTKLLNPYTAASAETQFTRGYQYDDSSRNLVSDFWNPGYLTQSAGMGIKPVEGLVSRLGFSFKETFSEDYNYADDVETAERESFKIEPGLEFITEYSAKFNKIILYKSKLNVFVNFRGTEEVDGKWENLFTAQVSKYLNVNFSLDMLYDHDMSDSRQIKQQLALGLNYSFL
ncbi:DUF3078 domain-containing protein [Fibrobacterota bacterium]